VPSRADEIQLSLPQGTEKITKENKTGGPLPDEYYANNAARRCKNHSFYFRLKLWLYASSHKKSTALVDFWPTVLSVVPLVQCVICRLSVCRRL